MIRMLVRMAVGFVALYFLVIAGIRWGVAEAHSTERNAAPARSGELDRYPGTGIDLSIVRRGQAVQASRLTRICS